jgi:hypothetical protein
MHIIAVFGEIKGMKKMQHKTKVYTTTIMAFLTLSLVLAVMPMANAAGAITLAPTTQAQGSAVTVAGTAFGVTKAVGIGLGAEVNVTGEDHTPTGTGTGPYTTRTNHYPIKPGSFSMHSDVAGTTSEWTDNGDGTITGSSTYSAGGTVDYVTGVFGRSSTTDISSYTIVFTASYTYYTYNVTPAAGVTTLAGGTFSASITVPLTTPVGTYVVTAVDTAGNKATANLTVTAVPEGLTIGVMVIVSTVAVIVSVRYFKKRPKIESYSPVKL